MPPEVQAAHRDRQQTSDARAGCIHPRAGGGARNERRKRTVSGAALSHGRVHLSPTLCRSLRVEFAPIKST